MKLWVDPPSGWRYGFPKVWNQALNPDFNAWLIAEGYPWNVKESYGQYFYCRQWPVEDDNQLLNEGQ